MESKKCNTKKRKNTSPQKLVVAIDMDNTIADMTLAIRTKLTKLKQWEALERMKQWENKRDSEFPSDLEDLIKQKVMMSRDFFYRLKPIPGAIEAIQEMEKSGKYIVFFLTSPLTFRYGVHHCVTDKIKWVVKHLGTAWADRVIVTKYKDLVIADVLIDDLLVPNAFRIKEPEKTCLSPLLREKFTQPIWIHVLYTQPYNADANEQPRISDWKKWKKTLGPIRDRLIPNV